MYKNNKIWGSIERRRVKWRIVLVNHILEKVLSLKTFQAICEQSIKCIFRNSVRKEKHEIDSIKVMAVPTLLNEI